MKINRFPILLALMGAVVMFFGTLIWFPALTALLALGCYILALLLVLIVVLAYCAYQGMKGDPTNVR